MANHYGVTEKNLTTELHQVKRMIERKKSKGESVTTPMEFTQLLRPYQDVLIDLYKLACISITLPVTSAQCERSFSCLKLTKTALRNSSSDERTSDIATICINQLCAKRLDMEKLVNSFANNHAKYKSKNCTVLDLRFDNCKYAGKYRC